MQTDLTTQPIKNLVDLALTSHNRGQLSEAEDLYQQVLDRDPENSKVLNLLGYLYHQIGNHELAIELIGQAIFVDPEQPYFYHTAGKVYFANRNFEDAVDAFRKAIDLSDAAIAKLLEIKWWHWKIAKIEENLDLIVSDKIEIFIDRHFPSA